MWIYDLLIFDILISLLPAFRSFLIACCVTPLYFLFNIELNVEECDATGLYIYSSAGLLKFLLLGQLLTVPALDDQFITALTFSTCFKTS